MEGNTLPPENSNRSSNSTDKKAVKGFTLLKMGILEIGFVGIVLFLFFGVLNYFNILSVSSAFPEQLGWLPRKDVPSGISQPKNFTPASLPTPTVTTTNFQYDTKKAETLLTQYIKENIKPEFLPSKIEIKQGLSINGSIGNMQNEFGAFLNSGNSTTSINLVYKEESNAPDAYGIIIHQKKAEQIITEASLANSLLRSYFINPYTISNCQTKGAGSSCESFKIQNDGKRGYGIYTLTNSATLFACFIPKDSKYYQATNSCIVL